MRRSAMIIAPLLCALTLAPLSALAAGQPAGKKNLLKQADTAIATLRWGDAAALLKKLIATAPSWQAYQKLGHAEFNLAQYQDAIAAFGAAADLARAQGDTPELRLAIAEILTEQGNVHLRMRDYDGAFASYRAALPFAEKYPVAYFNVCALDYTQGRSETALADCNAAIKADPSNADAYFIKGALLFASTTLTAEGKMVAPPEAVDALNMYLQLQPSGSHAKDVHYMLDSLN